MNSPIYEIALSYDVALSYASEQQEYVDVVARYLKSKGVKCFYDKDEEISLWGKNLPESFQKIFEEGRADFVVMFISKDYVKNIFPKLEAKFALSKQISHGQEYILPARFDDSEVPGLDKNSKYIGLDGVLPVKFAEKIFKKIKAKENEKNSISQEERNITKSGSTGYVFTIVDEIKKPLFGVHVCLIHPNGENFNAKTNAEGKVTFISNYKDETRYTVLFAHKDFSIRVVNDFLLKSIVFIAHKKEDEHSSVIFPNGKGSIPGLKGELRPILDSHGRTYLYADNIEINNNDPQPANFTLKYNIELTDSLGKIANIQINWIIHGCAIIDYQVK